MLRVKDIIASLDELNQVELAAVFDAAQERLARFVDDDSEEWETTMMEQSLGDALLPDGRLDFAKLRARGKIVTPEELFPEGEAEDES